MIFINPLRFWSLLGSLIKEELKVVKKLSFLDDVYDLIITKSVRLLSNM